MPENRPGGAPAAAPRLLDRLRNAIYARHYSPRTAEAYVFWARRFILFHGKRHPDAMGAAEVKSFLTDLALSHKVAASTQNQALSALLFLYRQVLGRELTGLADLIRAKRPKRAPVVLSPEEITRILQYLHGLPYLAVVLMYGSGLRLMECLELRIQDIDFDRGEVRVREGKGRKDRRTPLSPQAADLFRPHIEALRRQHARELKTGVGGAFVPEAIRRTVPDAAMDWGWQWVFPSTHLHKPPHGPRRRYHIHETAIQRAFARAVLRAGILRRATCHTLRHSFATHLLEAKYDIRTIQELMGHKDVSTTMVYTHVLNRGGRGVQSPLDSIPITNR